MGPLSGLICVVAIVLHRVQRFRVNRRWAKLRQNGFHLGADVWLPDSVWVDRDGCLLISIGDHYGVVEGRSIHADDVQMVAFMDA